MGKYISHYTAAKLWEIPNIHTILRREILETDPIDYTFTERSERYYRKGERIHLCTTKLPDSAVVIKEGQKVSSPELVFLELSNELNIHQLILLGMQLCSHPVGKPKDAITTKEKIIRLVEKADWHRGHRKALRALKYIENGSASIIESLVYMALCLPHSLGGYGLKGAKLNKAIKLRKEACESLKQSSCFADLYFADQKVAVEYDSFTYHSSPKAQSKDVERAYALQSQGIIVMSLPTMVLYDSKKLRYFANDLAAKLGKRIQIRAKNFEDMHYQLRMLFPTFNRNGY